MIGFRPPPEIRQGACETLLETRSGEPVSVIRETRRAPHAHTGRTKKPR